jgi:hypothetical protein
MDGSCHPPTRIVYKYGRLCLLRFRAGLGHWIFPAQGARRSLFPVPAGVSRIISKANPTKIRSGLMRGCGSHREPERSRDLVKSGNIPVWGTGGWQAICARGSASQIANRLADALSVLQDWPLEGVQTVRTVPAYARCAHQKPGTCDSPSPSLPCLIIAQMRRDAACRPAFLPRGPKVRFRRP